MSTLSDQKTKLIASFLLYILNVHGSVWAIFIGYFHFAVCLSMITSILDAVGIFVGLETFA